MIRYAALLLLGGCGGAPFDDVSDAGAVAAETSAPDAAGVLVPPARDAQSAIPEDANGAQDAGAAQDAVAAPPQDAAACTPFTWIPPADGSTQGPFGAACAVNADPSTYLPAQYAVVIAGENGCILEPTPAECRCAETFHCGCLLAHAMFCGSDRVIGCEEDAGAPVVSCR